MAILSKAFSKGNKVVASLLAGAAMVGAGAATPTASTTAASTRVITGDISSLLFEEVNLGGPVGTWDTSGFSGTGYFSYLASSNSSPGYQVSTEPSIPLELDNYIGYPGASFKYISGGLGQGVQGIVTRGNKGEGSVFWTTLDQASYSEGNAGYVVSLQAGQEYTITYNPVVEAKTNCSFAEGCNAFAAFSAGGGLIEGDGTINDNDSASILKQESSHAGITQTPGLTLTFKATTDSKFFIWESVYANAIVSSSAPLSVAQELSAPVMLPNVSAVPELGTGALVALGLAAGVVMTRLRKRSQTQSESLQMFA